MHFLTQPATTTFIMFTSVLLLNTLSLAAPAPSPLPIPTPSLITRDNSTQPQPIPIATTISIINGTAVEEIVVEVPAINSTKLKTRQTADPAESPHAAGLMSYMLEKLKLKLKRQASNSTTTTTTNNGSTAAFPSGPNGWPCLEFGVGC